MCQDTVLGRSNMSFRRGKLACDYNVVLFVVSKDLAKEINEFYPLALLILQFKMDKCKDI